MNFDYLDSDSKTTKSNNKSQLFLSGLVVKDNIFSWILMFKFKK